MEAAALEFELQSNVDTERVPPSLLTFHLLHIYRESLTNVIRHAQATRVEVRIRVDSQRLSLQVQDNGVGISEAQTGGRGLGNRRSRAEELGGKLTVEAASPGTRLVLDVPITGG